MGVWRPRIARDEEGKLRFVYARYDNADPYQRCGMTGIGGVFNEGVSVESMRHFAVSLLRACDEPIISMTERERESDDEDELEDELEGD